MPLFDYRAKDLQGQTIEGVAEAPSEQAALDELAERNLTPFFLQERASRSVFQVSLKFFNRIRTRDLVVFSRQLAVMVSATVPLVQSLRILTKQTQSENLKIIVSEVADEVEGGAKLSAALSRYPDVFSSFYVNMVRAGETSGRLDETLNYLADEAEKNYDLMSKIKGAMTYPAFILVGLTVVGFIMMTFVVPKLTTILQETNTKLPASTRLLIATSGFFERFWWLIIILLIALAVGVRYATRRGPGRLLWHRLQLRLPIFGKILQRIYLVRFTRSLASLMLGGVPLTRGLEVVAGVVGNEVYRDLITRTIHEVEEGNSISTLFLESSAMPSMVSQMLVVGEKTGRLEEIMNRLANFYSREVENMVQGLVTLIEPIIMVVLGLAVGVMVSAIILPIYQSIGNV
ncbi:MAG: type II secretion system F family protein [Candidatus Veblenbacteria bacterium]|nr:type II secretion system F family protein [Candidatus Veblenbacteria bacterium]